jgi:hypothetical protein
MPQPFKGQFIQVFDSLRHRPALAAHIGVIASMWGYVEVELGRLLAVILRSDAVTGMTLYMAIKAEPARLAAIEAIAAKNLSAADFAEYMALKKAVSNTGSQRDVLMHNPWALPDDGSDCLILLNSRKMAMHHAHTHESMLRSPFALDEGFRSAFWDFVGGAMEYKAADFEAIEQRITDLYQRVGMFVGKVGLQHLPQSPADPPS